MSCTRLLIRGCLVDGRHSHMPCRVVAAGLNRERHDDSGERDALPMNGRRKFGRRKFRRHPIAICNGVSGGTGLAVRLRDGRQAGA
jgi:hypothetical protein